MKENLNLICWILMVVVPTVISTTNVTQSETPCSAVAGNPPSPDWVNDGGIIILLIAVIAMFWGLALVCEEYFVPALNVLCDEWNIPSDVAGATFMAAGASSPELFTGLIGLLIYESNIGLGTVIGSEIFNHMIISAGSVLYAKNGVLQLDSRIVMRDLVTYSVSMLFFIYTLMDDSAFGPSFRGIFDQNSWNTCLSITTVKSAELLIMYVVYAAICGNFRRLTSWICPRREVIQPSHAERHNTISQIEAQIDNEVVQLPTPLYTTAAEIECLKSKPSQFRMVVSAAMQAKRERSMAEALYYAPVDVDEDTPPIIEEAKRNSPQSQPPQQEENSTSPTETPPLQPMADRPVVSQTPVKSFPAPANVLSEPRARIPGMTLPPLTNIPEEPNDSAFTTNDSTKEPTTTTVVQSRNPSTLPASAVPSVEDVSVVSNKKPRRRSIYEIAEPGKALTMSETLRLHQQMNMEIEKNRRPEDSEWQKGQGNLKAGSKWGIVLKKHREGQIIQLGASRRIRKRYIPLDENLDDVDLEAPVNLKSSVKLKQRTHSHCWNLCKYAWLWVLDSLPPADLMTVDASEEFLACYLYMYCDVIGLDALPTYYMWKLRYFSIDQNGIRSISMPDIGPESSAHGEQCEIIDLVFASSVQVTNPSLLQFSLIFESEEMQPINFRAPSLGILKLAVERLKRIVAQYQAMTEPKRFAKAAAAQVVLWADTLHQKHQAHNLLVAPIGRYALWWHYTVYILKFSFHYTLVDCRVPEFRSRYGGVIGMCAIWLALLSYIMIVCCNFIGSWINASPLVMGLTLAAIGTSFPNLISSMIVARQGYGNMAICNALGSNVFNVNVALGLPYFLLMLTRNGSPYNAIPNGGIVMQIFLLIAVAIIWIFFIIIEGFQMKAWMAWMYIVIYFVVMGVVLGLQ